MGTGGSAPGTANSGEPWSLTRDTVAVERATQQAVLEGASRSCSVCPAWPGLEVTAHLPTVSTNPQAALFERRRRQWGEIARGQCGPAR